MQSQPSSQDPARVGGAKPHDRLDCAIVTFYFPPALGGLEYYLERFSDALGRRVSAAVLAPRLAGGETVDARLGVPVIRRAMLAETIFRRERLFKPLYPFACALVFFWTVVTFAGRRPKLLCAGSGDFAWPVALAAIFLRAEFTFICHGKDGHVGPGLFSYFAKRLPLDWSMRRSRVCFANSRFTAGLLDPSGKLGSKIRLLRVPIDKGESTPTAEDAERAREVVFGSPEGGERDGAGPVILSVGRLREHKGFQHVIGAMGLIAEEFSRARYVIVGSGPFESELRAEAERRGVRDRVIFAGLHRPPDAFFALADVFATVTWEVADEPEGFGMVFIEAGCFGVPSIAGDIGGMPEAVLDGKTGFCVRGASPEAIAEALRKLLGDEALRRRMGEAAREYAREFEPDRIAETFIADCNLAAGA